MEAPGARTSSNVPRLLNRATASPSSVAPTVTALEMHPGFETEASKPLFPAAMTVAMPWPSRVSISALRTSLSHGALSWPPPRLRLAATMFHDGWAVSRAASASRAAIWSDG